MPIPYSYRAWEGGKDEREREKRNNEKHNQCISGQPVLSFPRARFIFLAVLLDADMNGCLSFPGCKSQTFFSFRA